MRERVGIVYKTKQRGEDMFPVKTKLLPQNLLSLKKWTGVHILR